MAPGAPKPTKPPALAPGAALRIISPASPADPKMLAGGIAQIERQGYRVLDFRRPPRTHYFAGSARERAAELSSALTSKSADAVICARGGYGCSTLLEHLRLPRRIPPKLLIGYSDITVLQSYLWNRSRLVTLCGPMVAYGFERGPGRREGYHLASWRHATGGSPEWTLPLDGEPLVRGAATGTLLGGCVTLLQCGLATSWDLDTRGAILLLEDVSIRPYQLDRMLVQLQQAGKFRGVRGILLGEFPLPSNYTRKRGESTALDVCRRILAPLGIPIVYGAAVGHTLRPMLTLPLGVRVRLRATGEGKLDILEAATLAPK